MPANNERDLTFCRILWEQYKRLTCCRKPPSNMFEFSRREGCTARGNEMEEGGLMGVGKGPANVNSKVWRKTRGEGCGRNSFCSSGDVPRWAPLWQVQEPVGGCKIKGKTLLIRQDPLCWPRAFPAEVSPPTSFPTSFQCFVIALL